MWCVYYALKQEVILVKVQYTDTREWPEIRQLVSVKIFSLKAIHNG